MTEAISKQSSIFSNQKPIIFIIGLAAATSGLLFGIDVGIISNAIPFIVKDFNIGIGTEQSIVSALLWGAAIGAVISGALAKKIGRKQTLESAALIFILGSMCSSIATSAGILIGARVFLGLGVGLASFTAPLYLSEMAPKEVRGALISMYQLLITIGIVLAFLSDTYFGTYAKIHGIVGGHWRLMLGIPIIPAGLMYIAVYFLPNSPRWLMLKNRKEEAKQVLNKLRKTEAEVTSEIKGIEKDLAFKQSGFALFFGNKYFRHAVFLGIGLQIIQQLTGINVIMYYAPEIFKIAGFTTQAQTSWGTVIVGVTNVLATFIAIGLVDKWGRKPIMYRGFIVMGISMLTVGLMFRLGVHSHHAFSFIAIAGILTFIIGFAFSAGPIIWVLCSEIYPLHGRDFGITVSTTTNWVVNGIVGATFLTLLKVIGPANTFFIYGGIEVLFIIIFVLFVPETKGVSLETIASNLLAGKKLRNIGS
ncbi:MAG: sugar porter family MFS transporter [Candidatus Cloacimonetes bacterium]|nr:sugar porter family MFS transporter [Candidatus Cloacimonadota bacterium]